MVSAEAVVISLANIGAVAYMVKRIVSKVDEHTDIMPRMLATQESIAKSLEHLTSSREDHDKRISKIETVHDFHGCNQRVVK